MTSIVVQCRLSSTRLPQKALYKIEGKELLVWTLEAMHKVNCSSYYIACDYDSYDELKPLADRCCWNIIAGPKDDVLERYCIAAQHSGADVILRATADNPLLFFEAAQELLDEYNNKYIDDYDYMTYTGLPHGSGVEIFKTSSLLKACKLSSLVYDHEHVGPALYNHPETFKSLFKTAKAEYNYPDFRTTVDTRADYLKAKDIIRHLKESGFEGPFKAFDIIKALETPEFSKRILFVPCTKQGCGSGHVRRCVSLAKQTKGCVYMEQESDFIDDFDSDKIVHEVLPGEYDLIVTDSFKMSCLEYKKWSALGPVCMLDEGSKYYKKSDYCVDVIPGLDCSRKVNKICNSVVQSPENVRQSRPSKNAIHKVLVCFGGGDPAGLTPVVCNCLLSFGFDITAVTKNAAGIDASCVRITQSISNLKDHLFEYDLVVTHYGFTAFESLLANTNVLLCGTTDYHYRLGLKHGFYSLRKNKLDRKIFENAFKSSKEFYSQSFVDRYLKNKTFSLAEEILKLAAGKKYLCPVCKDSESYKDKVVARIENRTFRKCSKDSMLYIGYSTDSQKTVYQKDYFAQEYKKQYGKTYLEDFESIKKTAVLRCHNISRLSSVKKSLRTILDIGCAYGPFLKAAGEDNWIPFGCDIAEDAVSYVNQKLNFKAVVASFLDFDCAEEFGVEKFDAVTMWYVIEHIQKLGTVLKDVNKKLKMSGVFAFSTPSAQGVSAVYNSESFFENSPKDHYTLWKPSDVKRILLPFGFRVKKIVVTGHHPERFPVCRKHPENKMLYSFFMFFSKLFGLGDTFEVYCVKVKEL